MGKVAFMFPGQASQYPGMGKELAEKYPAARAVFEEADKALGFSISKMCFEGTEEELKLTANTQPAILTVSVAAFRVLGGKGIWRRTYVAGHSLGEYSALVAVGSLKFADAVKLGAQARDSICRRRCLRGKAPWPRSWAFRRRWCRMPASARRKAKSARAANLNSPEQTVISGHASAVKRAVEIASQSGAKRAVMLAGFGAIPFGVDDAGAGKAGEGFATPHSLRICRCRW